MKKEGVLLVALVFLAFLLFLPWLASDSHAQTTLRFSNFFPQPHKNSLLMEQWCKEVEKRTNGKVKINYYPGGTLTPAPQTYDSVVKGIADIGESVLGYTRGKFPLSEVVDLPLGIKSGYVASKLADAYYKKFTPKEFDEVKVMYLHAHGPGILHTRKPVRTLEEMKGMKIRASGLVTKIVQALGGAPVGTPMGETYDVLSKGVADGAMAPYEALEGWKWGEVIKYSTEDWSAAYTDMMFVVMNKAKWNALPPDVQQTIAKINEEWVDKQGRTWDEIDKAGKDFTLKLGNQIITLTKQEDARWAQRVRPLLDDYLKAMKEKNLPGSDALKFCQDFLKANQK